ncbi:tRNA (5-methylaminomethyl-2-thiouridine)(34)-methyltransferase MnmD [Pedobacter sp. HMF7647]|uniref:tRNA (5-methylaminomethyl-2-thiouridine)(34)-methyltransferase MnmD n=1 Tax=Hufsiella arboris TaxID=2695275 RepID=A0A7K1YBN4_9SPHI|nr:tRNA (5-methylaminomethyl-2-thiouridine)(34)-methyltransferase MnmD [Hufsiella arboris]MXV51448.1 tRNA (5-methylaminomethyl-2-thiouridine)(34)-methyltransferase MnmD [Hufsiella arboris]
MFQIPGNLQFITTADGSKTLFNSQIGENYHSKHGAFQESRHVFVKSGLEYFLNLTKKTQVSILEVGFGTGLNFLLSAEYCYEKSIELDYTGIEAFPLPETVISATGYNDYVRSDLWMAFNTHYRKALLQPAVINEICNLNIAHTELLQFVSNKKFDIIYFDAFAAIHQPEMWNDEALAHITDFLNTGGVFVTYAITGNLKRSMKRLGFSIEKAPGAPGKREMLRAVKL